MKKIYSFLFLLIFLLGLQRCHNKESVSPLLTSRDVGNVIRKMNELMIHDVTNPPLAARFFAYTCLAGYEIVSENDSSVKSMYGVLNNYPPITKPPSATGYDYRLSAVLAMMETAGKLQPSGSLLLRYEQAFLDSCRSRGFSNEVIDSSKQYAQFISKKILAYAKGDGYNRISNYPRYKVNEGPGSWHPTPPAYLLPVEPYFFTIRPLTLDTASQFLPPPPVAFSTDKQSPFYKLAAQNYAKGENDLKDEERNAANFWDCNPFAVQTEGHMLVGLKKISPGAHWMGITGIACNKAKTNFSKTIEIYTTVAMGLMDGFICCWEAKYRTNRIRPETVIRQYLNPDWKPLLQTPPFPEYVSGHSVVSGASAVILSHYFGDHFDYTDDVEIEFGIPKRSFDSFAQAAKEAAMSRFWGGIHFMDAIDNGLIQGNNVGHWVLNKLKTHNAVAQSF